ncbi:hypothetical protein L596_003375 [Steinernema carpocapsae]|uniref:EGF-like domain-containing protein n=1 Tax=Steinernema carpocapsae TaxID=34508 RepID=A0A4U8UVB6_STECR|nr:hypothetical protein L596_003375 [Steinernema carpocapsae]
MNPLLLAGFSSRGFVFVPLFQPLERPTLFYYSSFVAQAKNIGSSQILNFRLRATDEEPVKILVNFWNRHKVPYCENLLGAFQWGNEAYFIVASEEKIKVVSELNRSECSERVKRASPTIPPYYANVLDKKKRFVELALFADHSMYEKYEKDEKRIHERLESIASAVNRLYNPLGITVSLVYVEVWKDADPFTVSTNPDETLSLFLEYRKTQIKPHPHDNAHLITTTKFEGIVGKAYKGTMCSFDYSGGVDVDHSNDIISVAATVAHEMGHNFGMEHDLDPDKCVCPVSSCIMAPALSPVMPKLWSECSIGYLGKSLKRGVDYCLRNAPKTPFGGSKCGNGLVESGEDCDCGGIDPSVCANKCCDPRTCKLAKDAVCATGDCCDLNTCKPIGKATVCRTAANSCDLPEYCDGENNHCPGDFYVQDGFPCPDNKEDYCYNGKCGNRSDQCRYLWGKNGVSRENECYQLNMRASFYGNCGYESGDRYPACRQEDVMCGRLHCQDTNERPEFGDQSSVLTGYATVQTTSGKQEACRVVRTMYTGDEPDPGMVPDGASCGLNKICVDTKCVNRTALVEKVQKCKPLDCHGLGVCNNVGNCHCEYGYGGESCAIPGYGGSVNSGPASNAESFNAFMAMFWLVLSCSVLFILVSVYLKRKKNIWLPSKVWEFIRTRLNLQSLVRVPVRKAPPPPSSKRQHNDFNEAWGDHPTASETLTPLPGLPVIPSAHLSCNSDSSSNNCHRPILSKTYGSQFEGKRPSQPPPVPPHQLKPDGATKPPLPVKPPVVRGAVESVTTVSVKDLAAKFNSATNV